MALRSSKYAPNVVFNATDIAYFEKRLQVLTGMTVKERRREMEKLTTYALIPTKKRMKTLAPKGKTGSLKKSIGTVTAKATGYGSRVGSRTGPVIRGKSKRRVFHAHLVELGTKKKKKTVKAGKNPFTFYSFRAGRVLRRKTINHGSKAQPFVEPAYQQTKHEYVPRIREKLVRRLRTLVAGSPTRRHSGLRTMNKNAAKALGQ
jgi:HK97 gp10 family phage protein